MALIKQKRTAWVIALFVESQTYSVIPTTWVFQSTDNCGKITIFAKWPPGLDQNVTSETIKNATNPTQDWSSYKIRLLDNGKEHYNFNKAWHKKIDYVKSATESEDVPTSSKKSKVSFIPGSESEDEEDEAFNVMPAATTSKLVSDVMSTNDTMSSNVYIGLENVSNLSYTNNQNIFPQMHYRSAISTSNSNIEPQLSTHYTSSPVFNGNQSNHEPLSEHYTSSPVFNGNQSNHEPLSEHYTSSPVFNGNQSNHEPLSEHYTSSPVFDGVTMSSIMETLNNLVRDQNIIKLTQERILSKIEVLEINSQTGRQTLSEHIFLDSSFCDHFPMQNANMFLEVEHLITNDKAFRDKLDYFIKNIGGSNLKNYVKRTLGKLFTDNYATQCTLTGRGKGVVTKISDSEIFKTIKKVIKEVICTMMKKDVVSDSEIEIIVAEWFRYSNTRLSRSTKTT